MAREDIPMGAFPKTERGTKGRLLARIDQNVHIEARKLAIDLGCTLAEFTEAALLEKIARHRYTLPER